MKNLTEKEAEDFLEKNNFKVAKRVFIKNKEEINKVRINFPWVIKISSKHIAHKSKIGGTILNITNTKQAEKAFEELSKIEKFEGVLIQEMILGEEFILGLKNTPEFGIVIMFGKGGTNVEKEKDISFRVPNINESDAEGMLEEIKFYAQVKNKINKKEIIKNILQLSNLSEKNPSIQELDINPLIVNNKEAIVVDARLSTE